MDEEMILGGLAIICAVGLPVVTALILGYQMMRGRHEERMSMIDKGIILEEPEKKANRFPALRNGLFMIGLALGIIIGIFVVPHMQADTDWVELTVPAMTVLFGGIGFVVYFFLSRRIQKKEEAEDNKMLN